MVEVDASMPSLAGLRVVVTRARAQAGGLITEIERHGAEAIMLPLLEIVDAEDGGAEVAEAVGRLVEDDWLVVLSPNGASAVLAVAPRPQGTQLAALGGGTAVVFERGGWTVDLMPPVPSSVGLLAAFADIEVDGRVLITQAQGGRTELADGLRKRGLDVEVVIAYRNVMPPIDQDAAMAAMDSDVVVFTSPSAVERYATNVGVMPTTAVCIGSVTAASALAAGFSVTTSDEPTVSSIIDSLSRFVD